MIKFIHTADIHFGVENYGKLDPHTGIHSRLLDFERALNFIIDRAIEEQVDFFLFAGDAYKTAHPSPTQQKFLMRCFLRLYQAKIPVVIIVGNHDNPLSFGKANSLEIFGDMPLEHFYVIDKPQLLTLETKHGPVQIVGIPWPTRNTISLNKKHLVYSIEQITLYISQAVSALIQDFAHKCDPTIPSVLAGHLTVSSGVFSGSEKRAIYGNDPTLLPSQLAIDPFDYVALGHLHRHQDLNPQAHPPVVYSGSIERIDFGERREPKGFCLVELEREHTNYHFIQTPMRPFIQIEVSFAPDEQDQTAVLITAIQKEQIAQAIIKIIYHLPAHQPDRVNLGMIERACASAHYLVGIFPVHTTHTREKRKNIQLSLELGELLQNYFAEKPQYAQQKQMLTQKALEIYAQSQQELSEPTEE